MENEGLYIQTRWKSRFPRRAALEEFWRRVLRTTVFFCACGGENALLSVSDAHRLIFYGLNHVYRNCQLHDAGGVPRTRGLQRIVCH